MGGGVMGCVYVCHMKHLALWAYSKLSTYKAFNICTINWQKVTTWMHYSSLELINPVFLVPPFVFITRWNSYLNSSIHPFIHSFIYWPSVTMVSWLRSWRIWSVSEDHWAQQRNTPGMGLQSVTGYLTHMFRLRAILRSQNKYWHVFGR